jgi:hypothetical protein
MSEKCATCLHKGLRDMVTKHSPYYYSGDIPCLRCAEFCTLQSQYVPMLFSNPKEDERINYERRNESKMPTMQNNKF